MALGQAFIEVHADLSTFRRGLAREIKTATDMFEKEINKSLGIQLQARATQTGRGIGQNLGSGINQGMNDRLGNKSHGIWVSITSALASALDDGISALPAEMKAALVSGILAVSPLVAGALAGAITAGVGAALAGIGVALASQFETVQEQGTRTFRNIRIMAVESAAAFEGATLNALATLETGFAKLTPLLTEIFDQSSGFVVPLTDALLDAVQLFLLGLRDALGDMGPFVQELGTALRTLGLAAGQVLAILASTGEDGAKAFRDFILLVAALAVGIALLIKGLTHVYGLIRDIAQLISNSPVVVQILFPHLALLGHIATASDDVAKNTGRMADANTHLAASTTGVIAKTKEEEKALKDLQNAIEGAADAALAAITGNADYEESIDNLAETLRRTGRNINIDTKEGRDAVNAFATSIESLRKNLINRVQTGELTTAQAVDQYNREIERIEELGNKAGITDQKFYELYGTAIDLGALQISPETAGIDVLNASIEELIALTREAIAVLGRLGTIAVQGGIAGARRGLAAGGILHYPETIDAAEEGPEVVIPLTKPARAAELMRQSGLDRMGMGSTQVMVFIDGQQMEARMVRTAERVTAQQGLALSQGMRGF